MTRPSSRRYLYPCSPIFRPSRSSACSLSLYSKTRCLDCFCCVSVSLWRVLEAIDGAILQFLLQDKANQNIGPGLKDSTAVCVARYIWYALIFSRHTTRHPLVHVPFLNYGPLCCSAALLHIHWQIKVYLSPFTCSEMLRLRVQLTIFAHAGNMNPATAISLLNLTYAAENVPAVHSPLHEILFGQFSGNE